MQAKPASAAALAYAASQQFRSGAAPAAESHEFADLLDRALGSVSESGKRAEALTAQAAAGSKPEFVDVVTAVAESEAALETLVAVRDKVVQAYDDIMRMPI